MKAKKPVLLVVMDGVGFSKTHLGDAVGEARTPTLDWMLANCPNTRLKAHGDAVGLPSDDDMGNSEVGHNAIGCGQIYSQGAKLVNESIESGKMYESDAWKELVANVKGKNSTMHFIGLLCRLYDTDEGEILLDGVNIRDYDYDEYMKLFSVVFQDFRLLAFSVQENVLLGKEDAPEAVDEVLEKVGLLDKVNTLPHGRDTMMFRQFEQDGVQLSGGEQQKLAIARALYKDAPIVILDEPTAALDPVAEYEIYCRFNELVGGKTAVYISHRLSSCKFCDRIAVFSDNTIKELGTHDELVHKPGGIYAEMFAAQAQYYV